MLVNVVVVVLVVVVIVVVVAVVIKVVADQWWYDWRTGPDAKSLVARWGHEIQVALMRRRAAMARAVLPRLSGRDAWMLTGSSGAVPTSERRCPPLGEHDADDVGGGDFLGPGSDDDSVAVPAVAPQDGD